MYYPNVVSLKQFYSSDLGRAVQRFVARSLRAMWPAATNETMLGLGYAIPYLEPYLKDSSAIISCMPAQQGAIYWPLGSPGRTLLMNEEELPFADNSFNRVLLTHMLEQSEDARALVKEIWRVLTPGGRVIAVVPNRISLWARSSNSPFGYGRPFSLHQVKGLLSDGELTYVRCYSALFTPPSSMRWFLKSAPIIERIGHFFLPMFGGVLVVEAEKQIYAAIKQPAVATARTYTEAIPAVQPA